MADELLQAIASLTPEQVASMAPKDQAMIQAALERQLLLRSPADFATGLSHGQWKPYPHVVHISNEIVNMIEHDSCDLLIVEVTVRHGKALALDTPIPTPTGWTTMGELCPGDELFDERGEVCRVKALSETWCDPSFVVSTDDGDDIVCHENHEWFATLDRRTAPHVYETRWLASRSQRVIGEQPNGNARHPVAPAVAMPLPLNLPEAELAIDPYTLGAWLGDGSSTHATMHGDGAEDQKWIRNRIDQAYITSDRPNYPTTFGVLGLVKPLRLSGLLGNKHIPTPYLRASISQRRALLQGLMDTDGHVAPDGQCEYTTILPQLAFDVQELVRSLGVKATIITGRATLNGRDCGPKYRVMFYMADAASIPRKAQRCRNASESRRNRYLTFTETAPVETRCIEVDSPSHLFLAGWSMTPTRNTELCSRWTPAWYTAKYRKPVGLSSYEADFAATHGRRVREIIKDVGPRFGLEIDETSRAANRWEVQGGGGMWTAGAGGPITGKGFFLGIVDDPIKNGEEANSAVMREHLWDWWQSTWITRREPGGKMLLIMSRWHVDDITGRLLKQAAALGMRIKTIRMPAIAEEDDVLGRRPGEALCPERYDEEALAGIRKDVGPGPWMSLYQQRPVAQGGGMLKPEWLQHWTSETMGGETYYKLGDQYILDSELWRFSTMDTAYTRNRTSDYTVIATWGVAPTDPHSLVLLNLQRRRVTHVDHAPMILNEWNTMKPAWVGIEKQMATLSVFDDVARQGVVVRWLTPDKNKVARAETAAALMEQGRIWVPKDAPWMPDFTDELASFPLGKHDDMVDVLTYACNELSKRTVRPQKVRNEPQSREEEIWQKIQKRNKAAKHRYHPVIGRI